MTQTFAKISEDELISLLTNNSQEGISLLYDHYAPTLYGVVMKIVGSEEVAKDILQDTFVKVWKQFSTYDRSKGRLFTWILNLARNRAIDYTRSSAFKNERRNQFEQLEAKPSEMSETKVDQIGLSEVMELLQPEVQEALEVVYFKGYSHKEASEYLNIPLGTVKTRVRNGLIDLRKVIK